MSDYAAITFDAAPSGVATLTINRPEMKNGLNWQVAGESLEVLLGPARDPRIKVLVLTGAGDFFCPGASAAEPRYSGPTPEFPPEVPTMHVPRLLRELPATTIAAINGPVAGAGLSWACGCDIRVAARGAIFRTGFLNVGVAGDFGLPWTLSRLVGPAKARELSILCEKFDADEAYRIGLVARVWEKDVFRQEAFALAERIAASAPLALPAIKRHYLAAERMTFSDFLDMEAVKIKELLATEDSNEAFAAFLEKRAPVFKGR